MLHFRQVLRSTAALSTKTLNAPVSLSSLNFIRGYQGAEFYDPKNQIPFEVSKNPEEWKYVSRLLPAKVIPDPLSKSSYPSGWIPQSAESINKPYFVRRSRNHMIPVYLKTFLRGERKLTTIRHIHGDIWLFASRLQKYIESKHPIPLGYKVDEVGSKIVIRGDFVHYATQFVMEEGF